MLSRDDAALASRDPALPGLATILDEQAMLEIVRGASRSAKVAALRATYVRYKPGTSCIVGYSAEIGGKHVPVYARTHGSDARAKLAKAIHRTGPPGALGFGVAALRNRDLVIFDAPNDDELRGLPKLFRADDGELRGANVMFGEHSIADARVTALRYKPERRFVARIDCGARAFVVKVYEEGDFEAIRKRGKQFSSDGPLVVAEPAAHRTRHQAILFDWIEGESLLDLALRDRAMGIAAAFRLGEALRIVHRHQPSKAIPKCDAACVGRWLREEIVTLGALSDGGASRAAEIARGTMAALETHEWAKVGLHGDFSHDQSLLNNAGAVMFDFDRALRGDPLIDFGRFAASLEMEVVRDVIDESLRDALVAELFAGSGHAAPAGANAVNAFIAAQLLLRAHEPFRLRWPNWSSALDRVLERAAELNGSACLAHR